MGSKQWKSLYGIDNFNYLLYLFIYWSGLASKTQAWSSLFDFQGAAPFQGASSFLLPGSKHTKSNSPTTIQYNILQYNTI